MLEGGGRGLKHFMAKVKEYSDEEALKPFRLE